MPASARVALLGTTWLAAALRFRALFYNHFHADEALFATWARLIAVWRDPLLQTQAVDKPPLLFYLQALFYPLQGLVEWAARLPNFVASILLIPLAGLFVWRLYRDAAAAVLTAVLVALSPLAVQYSATAFTDPLLTFFILAALAAALRPRGAALAGLFFGLALLTKHQAWLFLPLLLGVALLGGWTRPAWRRFLLAALPALFLLLLWQFVREAQPGLWSAQLGNFGGLRLTRSWELWPRLASWLSLTRYWFGSLALALLLPAAAVLLWRGGTTAPRALAYDRLIILFVAVYLFLHWLLAVPVWERYLLPLVPLVALLLARGLLLAVRWLVARLAPRYPHRLAWLLLAVVLILQLPAAWQARRGAFPIGGTPTADNGAWQVAGFLADEPYGTVLYDHWYSWHWRYHLFDRGVYVSWFPYPDALVTDLRAFAGGEGRRYLVLPAAPAAEPVLHALAAAGFAAQPVFASATAVPGMILYRVSPAEDSP